MVSNFKATKLKTEYYTQSKFIESARTVLGTIDLDPASCAEANETVKATQYYTEDNSGLDQPWFGNVWLNPPWGESLGRKFLEKLQSEYTSGNVAAAVVAFNAYTMLTTKWSAFLFDYLMCFPAGDRTTYHASGGKLIRPLHATAFVYLGQNSKAFISEFSPHGRMLTQAMSAQWGLEHATRHF